MRRRVGLGVVLVAMVVVGSWGGWSNAFISGDGKGNAANDCLIGLDGIDPSAETIIKGKRAVQCTDCDPLCDGDGVTSANGACTFRVAACVNSPDVSGCTPEALATASVKPNSIGVFAPSPLPADNGFACGSTGSVAVSLKKKGTKPGKKLLKLKAKSSGSPKRKDSDAILFVCNPRPADQACPVLETTTSTIAGETTTTVLGNTTSTTLPGNTTSTTLPGNTTSTSLPGNTTSTSTTTVSSTSSSSTSTSTTIPSCSPNCTPGSACLTSGNCASNACVGNVCKCPANNFIFNINSNSGGSVDPAEWPGGSDTQQTSNGCSVTVNFPTGNLELVGVSGDAFTVAASQGFSLCTLNSCSVPSCPPAGAGSCTSNRPSCSAALNGSGSASIVASCAQ